MAEVLQIDIFSVRIEKQADKTYMALLDWEIQQSAGPEYDGSYFLILKSLGASTAYPVVQTYANRNGYAAGLPLDASKIVFYTVSLSVRETPPYTSCREIPVTPLEYQGLKAVYDGQDLNFYFTPPTGINGGELILIPSGLPTSLHPLDSRTKHLHLKMDPMEYQPDETIVGSLRAKMSDNSYGPKISAGLVFTGVPRVESVQTDGDEISVSCVLADYVFSHKSSCYLNLSLYQGTEEVWTGTPYSLAEAPSAAVACSFHASGWGEVLGGLKALLYVTTDSGENRAVRGNLVPLSYPAPRVKLVGKGACITWEGRPWEPFCVLLPTGDPVDVTGPSYTVSASDDLAGEVKVAAVIYSGRHKILCPYSPGTALFQPGFYPVTEDGTALHLYQKAFGEKEASLDFGPGLLPGGAGAITEAPFEMTETEDGWRFLVDRSQPSAVTREKFSGFLARLKAAGLLPSGEYGLRRGMAHSGCVSARDSMWYLNHMEKSGLYADLFPGACLQVETAYYQPQLSAHADDSGYIRGAVSRYAVGMGLQDGKETLQFDGNLEYALGGWPDDYPGSGILPGAVGLADLFCKSMRKPYARLYYPEAFHSSRKPGSFHAMDNFCLAVSDDRSSFPETLADLEGSGLTYLIIRGRSTVTIGISVHVGGRAEWVPLGTTMGDMARRMGLPSSRGLSILRETGAETGPLPVYLERIAPGAADGLPLMAGDQILARS